MSQKSNWPEQKRRTTVPVVGSSDWIVWAAWADRVTFEEIFSKSGLTEKEVIRHMRNTLRPSSFRRWRKRVSNKSIKHRKRFEQKRRSLQWNPDAIDE